MSKEVTNLLVKARKLIVDEINWTQRAHARNSSGTPVHYAEAGTGCSYCMTGALRKAFGSPAFDSPVFDEAMERLKKAAKTDNVARFNDGATHKQVIAAYDKAIKG